jgi:Uma2 family endonuclease
MATETDLTPDDLITLPAAEGVEYELSEGELIKVGRAGFEHEMVKSIILEILVAYVREHRVGRIFAESMFPLADDTARIPDVSFVNADKIKSVRITKGTIPFAPDLAVEIISESEPAGDAELKVRQYLAAGVTEVWQVYAELALVRVRTRESLRDLEGEQIIESAVLPGFRCPVKQFFV